MKKVQLSPTVVPLSLAKCGLKPPADIAIFRQEYPADTDKWHRHCGFYELVLVLSGSARTEDEAGRSLLLRPGNFLLFRPGAVHRFCAIGKFKHYNLLFNAGTAERCREWFRNLPAAMNFLFAEKPVSPLYTLDNNDFPRLVAGFDALLQEYRAREKGWCEVMFFQWGQLLAELLRHGRTDTESAVNGDWRLAEAVRFMESEIGNPLTLTAIARHVNMSESSFRHRFRQAMDCPPLEYLLRLKLKRAVLLLTRNIPISQAAVQSGFADLNYFCRQFRRHLGSSPRKFQHHLNSPGIGHQQIISRLMQGKPQNTGADDANLPFCAE